MLDFLPGVRFKPNVRRPRGLISRFGLIYSPTCRPKARGRGKLSQEIETRSITHLKSKQEEKVKLNRAKSGSQQGERVC